MAVIGRQPAPAPIQAADIGNGIITPDKLNFYPVTKTADTGAANLPSGTTAQRPGTPVVGQIRYNSTLGYSEVYTSAGWSALGIDLSPFTQFNTTSLAHNIVAPSAGANNLQSGGSSTITALGAAAPSVTFDTGGDFSTHGGHSGVSVFPMYWACYSPNAKPVNQLKISLHGNSWGYFELSGSNDCGNSGNFSTLGTWTRLTLVSATSPYGNENMGGNSCGYSDRTQFTYNYFNNTPYNAYRIKIIDSSRGNQAQGSLYMGSAGYGWQLNRI